MSSSTKIDNGKKYIFILDKGPTQGVEHSLSAEKMNLINFTVTGKKFISACVIMEERVICLLMILKLLNSKQKIVRL